MRGSPKMCLYFGSSNLILEEYTNANMADNLDTKKSTFGYMFTFAEEAVSWKSKLQKCVALSIIRIEYIVTIDAGKEMFWMKRFLQQLIFKPDEYVVYCGDQSALNLTKNTTPQSYEAHWYEILLVVRSD